MVWVGLLIPPADPTRLSRLASDKLVAFFKLAKTVLVTPEKAVRPDFLALLRSHGRCGSSSTGSRGILHPRVGGLSPCLQRTRFA